MAGSASTTITPEAHSDGAGGLHLLVQYRHGAHGAHSRCRRPQGVPEENGPAAPPKFQRRRPRSCPSAGANNTFDDCLRPRALRRAAASGGRGRRADERRQAHPRPSSAAKAAELAKQVIKSSQRPHALSDAAECGERTAKKVDIQAIMSGKDRNRREGDQHAYSKTRLLTTFMAVFPSDAPHISSPSFSTSHRRPGDDGLADLRQDAAPTAFRGSRACRADARRHAA